MKAATASEMRQVDSKAIEEYGIPEIVLMENAGAQVATCVISLLQDVNGKKICVFAGKGNNGGDGFAAARHLANSGAKVQVCLFAEKNALEGAAFTQFGIIQRMGIDVLVIGGDQREWDQASVVVSFADCLIDALLGTGFRGTLSGNLAAAVDMLNCAGKPVVAVDIPSGVDADTGQVPGKAVRATHTVTFGLPKPGLFLYPGAEYVGTLSVADIGIPAKLLDSSTIKQNIIMAHEVRNMLPVRPAAAHKGACGRVCVVAGSRGMTGAAALAAGGALRAGAGLVTLGIAASLHDIMAVKLTEVMTLPLPETVGGAIGLKAVPYIEQLEAKNDVMTIGPGMGRSEETLAAIRELVQGAQRPLVIDADGLAALAGNTDILRQAEVLPVLTPHPGEMALLTGLTADEINQDRIYVARQAAADWASIVVLKGAGTVVAFPDGEVFINPTGNAGMATGGTGDVLAGVIAAFAAQGLSSHEAAVAGVYIHGMAGDIAARRGMIGMTAGDVLECMPAAIFGVQGG